MECGAYQYLKNFQIRSPFPVSILIPNPLFQIPIPNPNLNPNPDPQSRITNPQSPMQPLIPNPQFPTLIHYP